MADFFYDVWFIFLGILKTLPAFAVKMIILYFVVKLAIKKALQENQKSLDEKDIKNQPRF